ncbi:RNA methyltransferase [Neomicrococcus lactis]|uniref:tRNA G18 (Ribose-2'-O)-methylase SpoU n=2 Tax=Neomicrococcus lactis TaxID=732241 RepID=A0A7W8YA86_9MICC|nr:tRNA G18 (ribose-2'-O)-methylase SpoU [Neomicrococcus lactis]
MSEPNPTIVQADGEPFMPPNVVRLESAADPRVKDYVALSDAALRQKTDPERGLYIAESTNVVKRAIAAGHTPRSFFLTEKWLPKLRTEIEQFPDVPVLMGSPEILEEIAGFNLHRGALAAMNRPEPLTVQDVLANARRIVLLEDIVEHTNLGSVFRSAAGLGVDGILVSERCADPLYRRSIRVSMGGVFQIPWARTGPWDEALSQLKDAGFVIAAMELTPHSINIDEFDSGVVERLALVLGTEGAGISQRTLDLADVALQIPMRVGVD